MSFRETIRDQETQQHSEQRYRAWFEAVPVAVFVCDRMAVIQNYNRRAQEIWGRAPRRGDPRERYCGSFRLYRPRRRSRACAAAS